MRMRHAAVAAGLALGLMSEAARASLVINVDEVGANVIVVGSGTIDLQSLGIPNTTNYEVGVPGIQANPAFFATGGQSDSIYAYRALSGPVSIGPGTNTTHASKTTGDDFGLYVASQQIFLPPNYVSNDELSFTSTFSGQTIASLGLTNGSYKYTTRFGEVEDGLTINIGPVSPVPLPASAPMFGAALMALGAVGYGLKRKGKATA